MKKPKTAFGLRVSLFTTRTGMTCAELAERAQVKQTTLVSAMTGKTPGHEVVPKVLAYIEGYEKGEATG